MCSCDIKLIKLVLAVVYLTAVSMTLARLIGYTSWQTLLLVLLYTFFEIPHCNKEAATTKFTQNGTE